MIRELSLHQMMHVTEDTVLVTTLTGDEQLCRVEMRTRSGDSEWTKHATATVARAAQPDHEGPRAEPDRAAQAHDPSDVADELDPDDLYQRLRGAGQQHGTAFRGIVGLTVLQSGAARAEVRLPSSARAGSRNFLLHPVMMDIALQVLGATRVATEMAGGQTARQTLVRAGRLRGRTRLRRYSRRCLHGWLSRRNRYLGSARRRSRTDRSEWPTATRHRRSRDGGAWIRQRRNGTHQSPVHVGLGARTAGQNGRRCKWPVVDR